MRAGATVPAVALARQAGEKGGTAPAVYNAANETCVEGFRSGRLRFVDIVPTGRKRSSLTTGARGVFSRVSRTTAESTFGGG